jgi:NodT family efflux transporter outer membrane factor (OMF) lipoprotein
MSESSMERMVASRVVGIRSPDVARTDSHGRFDAKRPGPTIAIPAPASSSSARVVLLVAALATSLIAGCAVGPDFARPAAPDVSGYTAIAPKATASTANVTGGEAQRFAAGSDIPADWWTLFHSPQINALIAEALKNNSDLKAAQAALASARETARAQRGAYFPNVSLGYAASREQDPSGALAAVPSTNAFLYNLYTPQVSVSFVPDVFGLNRRSVESAQAQQQSVRYQMLATDVTLSANVAVAAIQQASLQAQIDATQQLVAINTKTVAILQYQYSKGYASRLDLAAQETQLAQTNATLPPLRLQLAQQRDQLAVLTGHFPSQAPAEPVDLSTLRLPTELPLSLPSKLVRQRPDVLQAEANLHAASAQVGIAIANRLPNITLSGAAGHTGLSVGQTFGPGSAFWNIAASLAAPIIDGGALRHQERAAKANYDQAAAQYRSAVLTAFQNVADTLAALEQDADGLKAAAKADDAAKLTLDLSQRQWKDGYASQLTLLSAEQAALQARIALVQAQASRFADTAALFQALGGGWWNADDSSRNHDEK